MAFVAPARSKNSAEMALYLHRFLIRIASSAIGAFLWIFIFEYFRTFGDVRYALVQTFLLYALAQTTSLLFLPFAMRRLRAGMLRGLVWGTVLLIAALVYIGALLLGLFPAGTAIIGLLLGAYGALYRVPYTVENAAVRRVGSARLAPEIGLALVPFIVGAFLVSGATPHEMFFVLALLPFCALVPLVFVPNVHELFSWGYRETFGHFAAPENRQLLSKSFGRGIFGALLFLLWPLVLLSITASYLSLGAAFSLTLIVIVLFRKSNRRMLAEQYADGGSYLDEYTALKEMGLALGRLMLALCLAIALSVF